MAIEYNLQSALAEIIIPGFFIGETCNKNNDSLFQQISTIFNYNRKLCAIRINQQGDVMKLETAKFISRLAF